RHLAEAGWGVRVLAPEGREPATPDAATMTRIAATLGIAVAPLGGDPPGEGVVVVDALLGTGSRGAPEGPVADAIAWIGRATGPVVAVDVPSGVEADTGRVPGAAVRAALTVTYHGDKVGLRVAPGSGHAGRVRVADMRVPSAGGVPAGACLAGPGARTAGRSRARQAYSC